ncbi:MAG: fumarylacetoacetate hydrolase family protein [Magnetococcales bacterium]|nr:fumarylacetoacetate hydrolase family protein [Magnetococcales bacterium]
MDNAYRHSWNNGSDIDLPIGKIVCVGRNYLAHIQELSNPIPDEPVLFMKPSTALVPFTEPVVVPHGQGACHHELEIAVLINEQLSAVSEKKALESVAGYGLALDLTLRDVQAKMKKKGLPWERAKAFDGSCPMTPFIPADQVEHPQQLTFSLKRNGKIQQNGDARLMMYGIGALIAHISQLFTVLPGDVILTGTPDGVGPLEPGDRLQAVLDNGDGIVWQTEMK